MDVVSSAVIYKAVTFNDNIHIVTVPNWMVRVTDCSLSLGKLCLHDPMQECSILQDQELQHIGKT